jgi:hypothetical protein
VPVVRLAVAVSSGHDSCTPVCDCYARGDWQAAATDLPWTWPTPQRAGPDPIDVTGTPGMTATRALDLFMAEWADLTRKKAS